MPHDNLRGSRRHRQAGPSLSRRSLLKAAGLGVAALAGAPAVAGCSSSGGRTHIKFEETKPEVIGYFDGLVAKFNAMQPKVTVTHDSTSSLIADFVRGDPPDISRDLVRWQAQPPLSRPGNGFGHLEVPQAGLVGGWPVLILSCLAADLAGVRRRAGTGGGIWCLPAASLLGPFEVSRAVRMTDESLYSGRLVRDRAGQWVMLAFRNRGPDGRFVGELTDPMPVRWTAGGTALTVDERRD